MDSPLLTIGTFARAVGLSASALRHYDEVGLLSPAEVDDATGYRYYTPDLADRARLVAQLRDAGVSIDTMRAVLDAPLDSGRAVLQEFLSDQEARSARTAAVVADVLASLAANQEATAPERVQVVGPQLASALRQVRPAADRDPASALTGVLLDLVAGSLDVVATNRYWMANRTLPMPDATATARAVLARAAVPPLAQLLDGKDNVWLEIGDRQVRVDGVDIETRHEPYPAHRILLAGLEPITTRVVLDRAELVEAIKHAGGAEVVLTVDPHGVGVEQTAGALGRTVDANGTGEPLTLRIGSALGLRAIAATVGPQVELAVSAPNRPVRITSPYQPGFLALLMPYADV